MMIKKDVIIPSLNILAVYAVVFASITSFVLQFYYNELPCPLCMLQRLGLLFVAFGFMLNTKYGFKASHYAFSLFGLLFMIFTGMRQVLLHIVPGSEAYGAPLLGIHLYTWIVIMGFVGILYVAFVLLWHNSDASDILLSKQAKSWGSIAVYSIWVLVLLNVINAFMICGFGICPDNPTTYLW